MISSTISDVSSSSTRTNQPSDPQPTIYGVNITSLSQCAHWHSPLDIIAIKHACCRKFYACISCHNTLETSHKPDIWKRKDWTEPAVFCGNCKRVWSVNDYMATRDSKCGGCGEAWNPGCKNHWDLYFDVNGEVEKGGWPVWVGGIDT